MPTMKSGTRQVALHANSAARFVQCAAQAYGAASIQTDAGPREARGATLRGSQVHSVRLPGYVISAEIIFGMADQRLTIPARLCTSARPYVDGGSRWQFVTYRPLTGVNRGLDAVLDLA